MKIIKPTSVLFCACSPYLCDRNHPLEKKRKLSSFSFLSCTHTHTFQDIHMYSDILALIRTCYRSTPYLSVSIIIVWRGYGHATLFLWSSALWVSATDTVGVRERVLQVVNVTQLVSCRFFFFFL